MHVKGITFVGTRTVAKGAMAGFVRDVLGLRPLQVQGVEAAFFALPDRATFAVSAPAGTDPPERTVGFLVDDVEQAARQLTAAGFAPTC